MHPLLASTRACYLRKVHNQNASASQVLATDGVWEVMTAQEVVHFVQRWRKRPWQGWNASDALTLEAQERWKQLQEEVQPLPCASLPQSLGFVSRGGVKTASEELSMQAAHVRTHCISCRSWWTMQLPL